MLETEIVDDFGPKLRKLGFKKKRLTWRRETDGGIEVFNVQRSQYGSDIYLNIGLYFGGEPEPHEYQCNVRERVEHRNREAAVVYVEILAWFEAQHARHARHVQPAPIAKPRPVRHAKLGSGQAVVVDGDSLRVTFDDGTTRVIKRAFLVFEDEGDPGC
jgi:Domain of unknown function (DUF4304)